MAKSLGSPCHGSLSPEGILREIQITLMECKVCFKKFSTQQRECRPQNLPCGHVLCLECIMALSHPLLRKLECPFCRQLCSVDSTSHCQALIDLHELLFSPHRSRCSAPSYISKGGLNSGRSSRFAALHLSTTFGGWGTLVNPTGMAVLGSSGTVVVVHDGDKRVVVFSPQGKKLNSFGQRGQASGDICYPLDVAVTPCGHVVVTDGGSKAVKVFTSRGSRVLTVKESFQLPWGVSIDSCGHILVSDVQAGTLSHIRVDYTRGVALQCRTVLSDLQHPKAVACCHMSGNTVVMEHPTDDAYPPGRQKQNTRLTVLTKDFNILYQTDSFSLTLQSKPWLNMSGVAFDGDGDMIVTDCSQGMIWRLENLRDNPVLTPLVGDHLIHPVGVVPLKNTLIILDSGDHAVKIYSSEADAVSMI